MGTTNAQTGSKQGNDDTCINGSSIDAFFAGSVILLTGATGFLGKALLEKLLRSCPRLATIFILIRPKHNQTVEQRLKRLIENSVFDRIRDSKVLSKVRPIEGDVALPNLGLSPEDRDLLVEKVNIVFHSAATVRFDEPLKVAVNLNTKGADRIIELCKCMKNLISVVHVSTAYSNANRSDIQESIYTTKVKPSMIIDMCDSLDEDTLKVLENKILENHPNTYTFTKNLAEQIILTKGKDLPIAIVRPSIICAAEKEPTPGWVDNISGITGIMLEVSRGTIRTALCNKNLILDIIPVDYVVDTLICVSWHNTMQYNNTIKVYNCTSSAESISWGSLNDLVKKHAIESPPKRVIWYPGCILSSNKFIHNVLSTILHVFPAIVIDIVLKLLGKQPMMMKAIKRFWRYCRQTEFFYSNEWKFHRDNMNNLTEKVKALKDRENFNVSMDKFNWDVYVHCYILGIRKFILKDTPETLEMARNRLFILYCIHRMTQMSCIIGLLTMIMYVYRLLTTEFHDTVFFDTVQE